MVWPLPGRSARAILRAGGSRRIIRKCLMERMDYFLRRLLLIAPTFLGITLLCFTLTRFLPGGPVQQAILNMKGVMVGEAGRGSDGPNMITEDFKRQLESYYGYDKPFYQGYYEWLIHNRLGMKAPSYKFPNKNAWQLIRQRLPVSLIFGITGFVLSYLICIPLGITKALRHGGTFDLLSSLIVFMGYAIPVVALGMVLKMLFCGTVEPLWDIFPVAGFEADNFASLSWAGKLQDRFMHMFLPVLCYVIG
ncbi:MAG: ABC transporter permease subunit, partial [Spartobacteria bacterium]|nr:ABC transporter permease subunit [Spartobacteria bacterium]